MKLRPTIFLSGVSSEFGTFREAVAQEILRKGCYPLNQPTFDVDYREIETILREKLSEADAVIHLVGFHYGDEPKGRPTDKPRRSYTQLEFDVARELDKPVYLFLSSDETVRYSEDELQLAHRRAIQNGNDQFHYFKDKEELCKLVAGIKHVAQTDFRVDISRIDRYAPAELIGRENELALLNDAWLKVRRVEPKRPHIVTFVALGGEGKTSLVAKWLADLAYQNWPGCDSAFAWSFYSQGTREQYAASSDLFLKEAITFFGDDADKEFAATGAGAYEKGQRLARIVGQRRALLILDGLEPLQYSPTFPTPGELKDAGIAALLKGLSAHSDALCIVTTRYSLFDLRAFWQTTAPEVKLLRLSREAGVHLLKILGVRGTAREFEMLVEEVKGHALTLNLLGLFLKRAFEGDISKSDRINLGKADDKIDAGRAFRTMAAYEDWLLNGSVEGHREVAVLRLMSLFDRPADSGCLAALREEPVIVGLTEPLVSLSEEDWNLTLSSLFDCGLVSTQIDQATIDCHPLLREYFAEQLREEEPDAFRAAHRRLYEHLCANTPDKSEPKLEDLQPLYQAVIHGCRAGLVQETRKKLYIDRILRGTKSGGFYSTKHLGAFASDLGAVACFFELPWSHVCRELSETERSWILERCSFNLRALGRLIEALRPMQDCVKIRVQYEQWAYAAIDANNLSELELTLGDLAKAKIDAEQAVTYADLSGNTFHRISKRANLANILHYMGRKAEAQVQFREIEKMHKEYRPKQPFLYSVRGFHYCDLLLAEPERTAWLSTLASQHTPLHSRALRLISKRATEALKVAKNNNFSLLSIALDFLTLGRVALYETVFSGSGIVNNIQETIENSVNRLRYAGQQQYLPMGLLVRAWFRYLTGARTGPQSAQDDLDEAWEIAERGPMRLHMADIHLHRARLFFREKEYPWESAEADLAAARKLIEHCGYWRRKEELEDAEQVILK